MMTMMTMMTKITKIMKITMMANMDMVLLARWMHFKTVHVNTSWMTTADETGAGNNHAFIMHYAFII